MPPKFRRPAGVLGPVAKAAAKAGAAKAKAKAGVKAKARLREELGIEEGEIEAETGEEPEIEELKWTLPSTRRIS